MDPWLLSPSPIPHFQIHGHWASQGPPEPLPQSLILTKPPVLCEETPAASLSFIQGMERIKPSNPSFKAPGTAWRGRQTLGLVPLQGSTYISLVLGSELRCLNGGTVFHQRKPLRFQSPGSPHRSIHFSPSGLRGPGHCPSGTQDEVLDEEPHLHPRDRGAAFLSSPGLGGWSV